MAATTQPARSIRIAILEADTPPPQTREKYGGYGGVFKAILTAGAGRLGWPATSLSLSNYDVVEKQEYPSDLNQINAILVTGSKHCAFEDKPWIVKLVDFVKQTLANGRIRVIGVCFGHQILGRALEVPVTKNNQWEISVSKVDLTDKGKEIFGKDELYIQQMHRDIVQEFPKDAVALGTSPVCQVQAMYAPGRYISVQGHPEFTAEIMQEICTTRHQQGIFSDELFEDAERRRTKEHDGVAIAAAFLKFLQE